jgi:acylphosphatase
MSTREKRPSSNPDGSQDVVALEVRVAGRVQGVGFRYFAHETARALNLVGYVMNLRDGEVRAYAEGPRAALEAFLCQMERGPIGAAVREVRSHWGTATGQYAYFSIERTA